jgi:hypothetical protein
VSKYKLQSPKDNLSFLENSFDAVNSPKYKGRILVQSGKNKDLRDRASL